MPFDFAALEASRLARGGQFAREYNPDDDAPEADRSPVAMFKCDECGRIVIWKIYLGFPGCDHAR